MKNGIERTKNTVTSSIGATIKYIANPTAKNIEVSRGKMPVMIKVKRTSWTTNIQSSSLKFSIDFE